MIQSPTLSSSPEQVTVNTPPLPPPPLCKQQQANKQIEKQKMRSKQQYILCLESNFSKEKVLHTTIIILQL